MLRRRLGVVPIWLVVVVAVIFALTTADVLNHGVLTRFDHDLSRRMLDLHVSQHAWTKRLVYLLTLFGQRGTVLVLTVPTVAYLCWRSRSADPAVRYAVALVVMTAVVYVVKDAVGRTAPSVDLLDTSTGASYPSGHVCNALLLWWLLWWSARAVDPARVPMVLTRVLAVIRIVGPICVVIGMTLLDYHWASDFVAGACIGVVLLAVVTLPALGTISRALDRRLLGAVRG